MRKALFKKCKSLCSDFLTQFIPFCFRSATLLGETNPRETQTNRAGVRFVREPKRETGGFANKILASHGGSI